MNDSQRLLLDWMRKIHQLEYAHCFQSLFYTCLEKWIGSLLVVLTTTIAFTYMFPFIEYPFVKEYVLPFLAFIVALLTGYQAFIRPNEKSEIHRKLGLEYEKIRHEIEHVYLLASNPSNLVVEIKKEAIMNKWNSLTTIYVKQRYYEKAKKKVKSFNKYRNELDFIPEIK